MKIGDYVKYIGIIKTTDCTPKYMFEWLIEGNIYRIINITSYKCTIYYFISDDDINGIWYPKENFYDRPYNKESFADRYNLK